MDNVHRGAGFLLGVIYSVFAEVTNIVVIKGILSLLYPFLCGIASAFGVILAKHIYKQFSKKYNAWKQKKAGKQT